MSTTGRSVARAAAVLAVLSVASCGGKAVVDGQNGHGGGGGTGGSVPTGICATPEPYGGTILCASGSTPTGCYETLCDATNAAWRATCTATGCFCSYNDGQQNCSCTGVVLAEFCSGYGSSCCPDPFP